MINLFNRTEYSFRLAFGPLEQVLDRNDVGIAGICDRNSTWGHVAWEKACKKRGVKPIFGVELCLVDDASLQEKQGVSAIKFIAKNNAGLKELYELVTLATNQFYYLPRIDMKSVNSLSENIFTIISTKVDNYTGKSPIFFEINPATQLESYSWAVDKGIEFIASSDNYFPSPDDKGKYEVCIGNMFSQDKATKMHIFDDQWDWRLACEEFQDHHDEAIGNCKKLADLCEVELPRAELVHPKVDKTLLEMCEEGAIKKGVDLSDPIYKARLDRELMLIDEKKYEDYFFLIADLIQYAKKHMLVGPARGSSCGSLVCYLIDITAIDPIPYDLLFERFIDINREDLPDIDIDFPDNKREMVFEYLRDKYGAENVAQLGTVNRYKAKSAIGDAAKELRIPAWEVNDLKNAIIERSGGDSRAAFCIMDTFNELEIGKTTLAKYPELEVCQYMEMHAKHSGKHAAGIVVTDKPVSYYCSVDAHAGAAQVDKKDAEELNLLKIDALGLRTLSVIEDCLESVGWSTDDLQYHALDDKGAFKILNDGLFYGIFQFEGYALQSLCHQLVVENFEDMVSLTALARPGPLNSGGATEFLKRRMGDEETKYLHPMAEEITKVTYGVIVYQEQVMQISREMGDLSWEDVSNLRKAMSKSLGKEFFDKFWEKFKAGAIKQGVPEETAKVVWDNINTMGSWAFNRSHAVAYGLVSYWCCLLKSKFPLEYAAACLRHSKDDDQAIKILRELDVAGFKYKPIDKEKSKQNWTVVDGHLVGGLINVKGIAQKTADDIMKRRNEGKPLTPSQQKKLDNTTTPFDMLYECKERFGHIFEDPSAHGINSKLTLLEDIDQQSNGVFVFIAKLTEKNLRDHNELQNLEKRGGKLMKGQTSFLNITCEDDTSSIICTIDRYKYLKYGKPIVEEGKNGDWYIFKGRNRRGFRKIYIDRWKKLS